VAEWRITSEDTVLGTPWFGVSLAAVELPGGQSIEHYVLRRPPVALTAVLDDQDRVLLVWRYRFITGAWGWELPSGLAGPQDDLAAAAAREALAETGWEPLDPRPLLQLHELPGLADAAQHVFWTDRARQCGEPGWETTRLEWVPLRDAPALIAAGQIRASSTVAALLYLQASPPRDRASDGAGEVGQGQHED
jgi:8-oxo-dGTP pyrophosphatase MutT (NUDIX family)